MSEVIGAMRFQYGVDLVDAVLCVQAYLAPRHFVWMPLTVAIIRHSAEARWNA